MSNYATDLFMPIFDEIRAITGAREYTDKVRGCGCECVCVCVCARVCSAIVRVLVCMCVFVLAGGRAILACRLLKSKIKS
jgi:hypothetical protein